METRRKTDVALFLPFLAGGGAEKVLLSLASGFIDRGLEVDLLLTNSRGVYWNLVHPQLRVINFGTERVLKSLPKLARYLRRERAVVLLSSLDHANLVAIWAKYLSKARTKNVIRVDNVIYQTENRSKRLKRFFLHLLVNVFYCFADRVIAVSRAVAADLGRSILLPAKKIQTIYNPVSISTVQKKSREPLHHSWFSLASPPVILASGRLTRQKDFSTLISAFSKIRKRLEAKLVILGEGEDRGCLQNLVKRYDLEKDVDFPGFVENPYTFMAHASVFVLSSRWEGCPVVLLEALAAGTPVVATDCPGGSREILDHGRYGRLVPVGDAQALAKAIMECLTTTVDLEALRQRATRFDLDTIVDEYLKIMERK